MPKPILVALDLAKSSIQVAIEDCDKEKILSNKSLSPAKLSQFLARQAPCTIAMEACGGAHFWCWQAESHGHEVILLPPHHVLPYRQGHKTDKTDALAILAAAKRPDRKLAVRKTPEMMELQTFLKVRQHYVDSKRQLSNQIRGHLLEFGHRIPKSYTALNKQLLPLLEDAENNLGDLTRELIYRLYQSFLAIDDNLKQLERQMKQLVKNNQACQRLCQLEGVGPVVALLLYTHIGDGSAFKNGREASALIGVTPQQHSSGGVANIGHIRKKHVDKQTRALLLQGAKAVVYRKRSGTSKKDQWLERLIQRRGANCAAVALVNKNIRTAWAMLSRGEDYVAA